MPKRKLRIVREVDGTALLGVCEYCNMQFAATLIPLGEDDQNDVHQQFNAHKCKSEDFSQAAVRTVKATHKV